MKRIAYLIITIVLVTCYSCEDYLTVNPNNSLADATFWKTEGDANQACIGVYAAFAAPATIRYNILEAIVYSDDATLPWPNAVSLTLGNGAYDASHAAISRLWGDFYLIIRKANVFLSNIDKPEMDESVRKRLKGEVQFIRAYMYSMLISYWGAVPLVTQPLEISELKIGRTPKDEIVDFLLKDLDEAISNLPLSYDGKNMGRVTKGAALALKSRVALFAGNWQEAASAAKLNMDLQVYGLFVNPNNLANSYEQIWDKHNENNLEVIFDIQYFGEKNTAAFQYYMFAPGLKGIGGPSPYQELVDAYECVDGKPISESSIYDPLNPFANRDPRLQMSIIKNGDVYKGYKFNTHSGIDSPGGGNASRTGYYVRKLLDDDYEHLSNAWDVNMILIRYAEVLLNYAEAKIESGSIDQSVLDAINSVRARAYGVAVSNTVEYPSVTTMNQNELRTILRRERRIELAFEGIRAFDIRRWKIAETAISGPMHGHLINGNHNVVDVKTFDPSKNYLWPIPQSEIDLIGSDILIQNTGY